MSIRHGRTTCSKVTVVAVVAALLALGSVTPASAASAAHRHGSGFVPSGTTVAPDTRGLVAHGRMRAFAASLPSAVSLAQYTVPVGDQGMVNSCTTWAIGYSMLGWYSRRSGSTTTYAPMYLYSQDHLPNDGGSSSDDAYSILTTQGIAPQSDYSGGDLDWMHAPSAADRAAAAANVTTAPHYLFRNGGTVSPGSSGRTAIETAIAAQHPVALAIPIFELFRDLNATNHLLRADQIAPGATDEGGHQVLVVGYDATGVLIQNQWGTSWGDGGFATLDWAFVERYALEASWIWGFSSTLPASAPAQVDGFASYVTNRGTKNSFVAANWTGVAEYDDSVRHPVTQYVSTLTGPDGTTQSAVSAPDKRVVSFPVEFGTTYTLSVSAINAIGTGPARTFTFTPSDYGADARFVSQRLAGTPLPSPTMPEAAPTPLPSTTPTPVSLPTPTPLLSTIPTPVSRPTTTPLPSSIPTPVSQPTPTPLPSSIPPLVSQPTPTPLPSTIPTPISQPSPTATKPGSGPAAQPPKVPTAPSRPSAPKLSLPTFGPRTVTLHWGKPTQTSGALSRYQVIVLARRTGGVPHEQRFLVAASKHTLRLPFVPVAQHGRPYLRSGLTTYRISLRVQDAGGRWSRLRSTVTTVTRVHGEPRYLSRRV